MRKFRNLVLAGVLALACLAHARSRAKLHTEDATIAFDNKGTCWLSFVVTQPKSADMGVKLKVTRPVAGSPEPGLPAAVLGPGASGSWIWIGEGTEDGMAALFTLDNAAGRVTWVVLTPRIAREYLRAAGNRKSAGPSGHAARRSIALSAAISGFPA